MPKREFEANTPGDAATAGAAFERPGFDLQAIAPSESRSLQPLSVLLADDNRMIREALLARIRQVVGEIEIREAFSAEELFAASSAREGRTDLFLVDMSLPGLQEIDGLRELRRLRPDAMLIAIGCPASPNAARAALEIGVSAYLLRSMGSEAFSAALALVLSGERFFPASVMLEALKLANAISPVPMPMKPIEPAQAPAENLTPRQLAVLRHLAAGKSNKEIARALGIQEITVKVHLQAIFARIGVSNRTQAAMHAERAGWFAGLEEMDSDGEDGKPYSN